ncbi:hypothetical protein KAW55_01275 [bacterium]|nr:hypothetical protein [bacterium]MCK4325369.1 hypothetical protein [bacterium]
MKQIERYVYLDFQIDTNRINSRGRLKNMNQLEKWHDDGVIVIEMSEVAQKEAIDSRDQKRLSKTTGYIYSKTLSHNIEEQELMKKIERILFPSGARNRNEKNDVEIIFNAKKYRFILVTSDGGSKSQPGGILGHKAELKKLGIEITSDKDAVQHVKSKIMKRDQHAISRHQKYGLPLPEWVGKDKTV